MHGKVVLHIADSAGAEVNIPAITPVNEASEEEI